MNEVVKLVVEHQGDIELLSTTGYNIKGDGEAVCFYIDFKQRAYVACHYQAINDCPVISLQSNDSEGHTEIEFIDYPGWSFHSSRGGKTVAIALVKK